MKRRISGRMAQLDEDVGFVERQTTFGAIEWEDPSDSDQTNNAWFSSDR